MTRDSMAPDAFVGTASDYARYRPQYPDEFLADLRSVARTTGQGSLLDLACGPGRAAIPLAPYFRSVLAVDVEAEMIGVGKEEADKRGVTNIAWHVERAEDLVLPESSVELITIGEAFHRLDQQRTLMNAMRWLQRRGSLATLGGEPVWRGDEAVETSARRGRQRVDGPVVGRPQRYGLGRPRRRIARGRHDGHRSRMGG